jgi:Protein of unknown function (DUF1592)/Protein of unknown function (DUF1588)/Protein of unknown function (DUF1595)/Protein of unknown function (DUF1585)
MRWQPLLVSIAITVGGCIGLVGDDDRRGAGSASDDDPNAPFSCSGVCVGESGMMRLTRSEYMHSVQAVFGDVVVDTKRLPADSFAGPFDANDTASTEQGIADYSAVAWDVGGQVAPAIAGACDESTCAGHIVDTYGEALLRRPLSDEERAEVASLFDWSAPSDGVQGAVELVVATLLQSPSFLYRVEAAADGDEPTRLRGMELATRLSLFLWSEGPDPALRAAALAGELDDDGQLAAHAQRLLEDPRGERAIRAFHRQWLSLDELPFDATLAQAMRDESEGFALAVFANGGTFADLLMGSTSPVSDALASHYGVASGDAVEVPGHVGILSHASVMSRYTSVSYTRAIHRGDMLLTRVLCHDLGTPPPDAVDDAEETVEALTDDMTDREKLEVATGKPACAGCHEQLNPAGYVFESFDSDGRFRTHDAQDNAIDTSVDMVGLGGIDGGYAGLQDLMAVVAQDDKAVECLGDHWVTFALRRPMTAEDRGTVQAAASTGALRDVLVALVTTDAFRYRLPR